MRTGPPRDRERGAIAVFVLWGLVIVFVLLAAAGFTTRGEVMIARNALAASRARNAAIGGTQLGLARLLERRARGTTIFDGQPEDWRDGTTRVEIAIRDEAGKIDLNQAPLALLAGLFAEVGTPNEAALLLACRIVAHRGGSAASCPAPAADGANDRHAALFAAPEELAQLPGMTDRLYRRIADYVTVATGASAIDPAVASRDVLMAVPGATPEIVDAYLAGRTELAELDPEGSGFAMLPPSPYLMVSPLRDFTVSATATTAAGARFRADLQIRLSGVQTHPYDVIAWRSPPPAPWPR